MNSPSPPPLLAASGAHIAMAGHIALRALDFATVGERVVLTGNAGALVALLLGFTLPPARSAPAAESAAPVSRAELASGALALAGRSVAAGEHTRTTGSVPFEPPLPGRFTVRELCTASARLAGIEGRFPFRARRARDAADHALERLGCRHLAKRRVSTLTPLERRAVVLARALAGAPEVLVVADPLAGLDGEALRQMLAALEAAVEGRRSIVWLSRPELAGPEAALVRAASDVVVFGAEELVACGPPAEALAGARLYELTIRAGAHELAAALRARGADLSGGPEHFALRLPPPLAPRDVLVEAARLDAAVVRCVPVF